MSSDDRDLGELKDLVLTAFEMARARGSLNWRDMSTAVLKNRLMQTTGGKFHERYWGFRNMVELVASMPELLSVSDQAPYLLHLKADEESVSEATIYTLGPRARIRDDLWFAVMDYSVGHPWVWSDGRALPASPGTTGENVLPTISPDIMSAWRDSFIESRNEWPELTQDEESMVEDWRAKALSSYGLPRQLRGLWNAHLKRQVVERLTEWFTARSEDLPADLLTGARVPERSSTPVLGKEAIRDFVERCVAAMTDDELLDLPIPAGVVVRLSPTRWNK